MHFMGELVLHRTQVEALAAGADVPGLSQAMQNLTRTSHALQSMVMQVRMIPVEAVFLRFPRLVRDLSTKRSEEHTSELQLRQYLVCRLLLEKKKITLSPSYTHTRTTTPTNT